MFDQLESIVGRYEELGELLSDPEVVSDTKRFMELSREEADLRDKVATYNAVSYTHLTLPTICSV